MLRQMQSKEFPANNTYLEPKNAYSFSTRPNHNCSHIPSFVKTGEFRSEWASPHLLNDVIGIHIMNTFKSL